MHKLLSLVAFTLTLSACDRATKPSNSTEVASVGLHTAAISDNGEHATVGSIYHGASLWRLGDGERLYNWNHQAEESSTIVGADISDDGRWALTAEPHTLVLWNIASGKGERYWTAPAEVLDAELNASASLALLALEDHSAVIFDIRRGGIRRTFNHENRVRSVDFSADGSLAITGSEDYSAAVWETRTGKQIAKVRHEDDVQLVKLSDDGVLALSVSKYDKAIVWNTSNGELMGEIPLQAERLKRGLMFTAARFSADNQFLLTGRPDQIVQLWQLAPLQEIHRWKLPKRDRWKPTNTAVLDVAFSENNTIFYAAGSAGFVHELKVATEKSLSLP